MKIEQSVHNQNTIKNLCSGLISSIILLAAGCAEKSYDQCIVDSMGDAQSEYAAYEIRRSCRSLYPKPEEEIEFTTRILTEEEVKRLEFENPELRGSMMRFDYYNGNENLVIRELTVSVSTTARSRERDKPADPQTRIYVEEVNTEPQSVGYFSQNILRPEEPLSWSFSIIGAKGEEVTY